MARKDRMGNRKTRDQRSKRRVPEMGYYLVVTDTEENDIILMHDCYGTSVEAALQIIDILSERGYEFVTVDRLLLE